MKNIIYILFISILWSCAAKKEDTIEPDPVDPVLKVRNAAGEWKTADGGGGGFDNFSSFKNFQYNFDVAGNNQSAKIDLLSANIDVKFTLFNRLGEPVLSTNKGRNLTQALELQTGTYRLVISSERLAVGKFEVHVLGVDSELTLIPSAILKSNTQNWGKLGGGGNTKSFKNHFYTFDITDDNSAVDIELESSDTDIILYLYDALGTLVGQQGGGRYEYILMAAKKGNYTIMAGTETRGSVGNYALRAFGKIENLQKIESAVDTKTGIWADVKSNTTFSLDITSANNSSLDIELSSGDTDVWVELQTGAGDVIARGQYGVRTAFIVTKELPKATYRIYVRPYVTRGTGGNFSLTVNGKFANLKQI